jgi:siroheme synthase-like protein
MTLVMTGLDVTDRLVVLIGGGDVTARRAERLCAEGAAVRIVAPELSARTAALLDRGGTTEWVPRRFRSADLDGAWLVHTATGDPEADRYVGDLCRARRIWCVDAGDGERGSARMAAEATQGDLKIGIASAGSPDPRRSGRVRGAVQDMLDHGLLPTRRVRTPKQGSVSLIGDGPGQEDLLTVRGNRLLLEAAGITVEVIPGISSAVAGPRAAGVPVTHRGTADTVHIVNGHRSPSPATLAALQDDSVTVVVLMGVSMLTEFATTAPGSGAAGERPVAGIENAQCAGVSA